MSSRASALPEFPFVVMSILFGLVGVTLYLVTWGLSGLLIPGGVALAVIALCIGPRRSPAWIALAVNGVCMLLLFPLGGSGF
jgi:hypothetical protein